MKQRKRGVSRRRVLVAAGGLAAAPYALTTVTPASSRTRATRTRPVTGDLTALAAEPCDLSRRWLHLKQRVELDGLVGAWPMDEGSGYHLRDVTGNGHTLFPIGSEWNTEESGLTAALHRRGRRGMGVYLNGHRWLQAKRTDSLHLGSVFTLAGWLHLDATPSKDAVLIGRHKAYGVVVTDDRALKLWVRDTRGRTHVARSKAEAIDRGEWSQVTATVDGATGKLAVYLSARKVAEADGPRFTPVRPGGDLLVGHGLRATLDEVVLLRRVLDPGQVRRHYLVGLPKVYTQTRETIDAAGVGAADKEWTRFKGSEPVPHPITGSTVFTARFDATLDSEQGAKPVSGTDPTFLPGRFGGVLRTTRGGFGYPSPLSGGTGTFEAWYAAETDSDDPDRTRRKVLFHATGARTWLTLFTRDARWQVALGTGQRTPLVVRGPRQKFAAGLLEHIAVSWSDEDRTVVLYVNGVPVGRAGTGDLSTTFDDKIDIGGGEDASAHCYVNDVRISERALGWGEVCPRGQLRTDAAGLDLRDFVEQPDGVAPMLWRPGSRQSRWTYRTRDWEQPELTGDDPRSRRALYQAAASGTHYAYHPDAYGNASSIEVAVAVDRAVDGWIGSFVQASAPGRPFEGHSFAINPSRGVLRLARHSGGRITDSKVLRHDFPIRTKRIYELTLTAAGDGLLRGFVDGHNVISMRAGSDARDAGYAGLFTDGSTGYFDNIHFTALTPARARSRLVQVRAFATGSGAGYDRLSLEPLRWHKRRGKLPWGYTFKHREPAGNIAGGTVDSPPRPIPPAFWRSEDSANSDLTTVDGRMIYFMRGNARVDGMSNGGQIGVLDTTVDRFDGLHFRDPSRGITDLDKCKTIRGRIDRSPPEMRSRHERFHVNDSGSAYVGDGKLLVFFKEVRGQVKDYPLYRRLGYGYYEVRDNDWIHRQTQYVDWSYMDPADPDAEFRGIQGTPEVVSLRHPDTDEYTVLLYHGAKTASGQKVMGITGLRLGDGGVPQLDPEWPTVRSIGRPSNKTIYSFRVLFDNGIYYLQYAEGPHVPDWPDHFVLAATTDPYQGPWVVNPDTDGEDTTYFRRGRRFLPDNAAIWQGCMVKHRGRYYMYYENFHAIDVPYQNYNHPQAGSRVGFATAT